MHKILALTNSMYMAYPKTNYEHSSGSISKSEKDQYGVEHYNQAFDQQIRGIYYVLLTRGIHGVRVFFQNKALEKHFKDVIGIH